MYGQNIVAFFSSLEEAEKTRDRLINSGIQRDAIRLSRDDNAGSASTSNGGNGEGQGFFEWIFGSDVPDNERSWYDSNFESGRVALSVRVKNDNNVGEIERLLNDGGALEVDRDDDEGDDDDMVASGMTEASPQPDRGGSRSRSGSSNEEEVIPVVQEELMVGKVERENRRRIRTHVVERPVQEQVELRDETIVVERRPVSGQAAVRDGDLQEREYEIIERHEEPIVGKRARAVEEVVVKKDVRSRTETIDDTVRETEVEVEGQTSPNTAKRGKR